jgi:hypothetical protein
MPSERRPWLARAAGAALLLVACTTQHQRRDELCWALATCTGYVDALACQAELNDALVNERIGPSELTQCSRCVLDNAKGTTAYESCDRVLLNRDCDAACREVSIVLDARTSRKMRRGACSAVHDACGVADCNGDFIPRAETIADQQARDQTLLECVTCIAEVPPACGSGGTGSASATFAAAGGGLGGGGGVPSACAGASTEGSPAAGAGGAPAGGGSGGGGTENGADTGGAGGEAPDRAPSVLDTERCFRMVEHCSAACVSVAAIDKRLTLAAAAAKLCEIPRTCPSGEAGAPPVGSGPCDVDPDAPDCFDRMLRCPSYDDDPDAVEKQSPRDCLGCLQVSACSIACSECEDLFSRSP